MVSFVVIAYNEERAIERCLDSILGQRALTDCEIIVVDDGSTDRTAECVRAVASRAPQVRLISLGSNRGRGAARAAGVREAIGGFLAFVDADIVLPADWLSRCLAHIEGFDAVGGIAIPEGDATYVHRAFRLTPRPAPHSTTITGNNGLFLRSLFERIEFDATLRDGEDVALGHEMKRVNASAATVPGLLVEHREHKSYTDSLRWLFQSGRGAARQLIQYREVRGPDVAYIVTLGVLGGAVVLAVTGHPLGLVAVPLWLAATAVVHVNSRFIVTRSDALRAIAAVGVDTTLMAAYFGGRAVGPPKAARTNALRDSVLPTTS